MAYLDRVGDIMRTSAYMAYPNGQVQVMTHHFMCLAAGPNDTRGALAVFIRDQVINKFMNLIPAAVYFPGVLTHQVWPEGLRFLPAVASSNANGSATGVTSPTQVRAVLRWETDYSGPGGRGRNYIFTVAEGHVRTDGHVSQTMMDAVNGYGIAIRAPQIITGTTWSLGLWHRHKAGGPDASFTPITNLQCMDTWGTQVRSGDYGKLNKVPPDFPPHP
jgi:hypothetical protein